MIGQKICCKARANGIFSESTTMICGFYSVTELKLSNIRTCSILGITYDRLDGARKPRTNSVHISSNVFRGVDILLCFQHPKKYASHFWVCGLLVNWVNSQRNNLDGDLSGPGIGIGLSIILTLRSGRTRAYHGC